jgi:nitrogen fixation protein NifQ
VKYRAKLIACAGNAGDPTVLALAGVLSAAFERQGIAVLPIYGLDARRTRRLFHRWFPGADLALQLAWSEAAAMAGDSRHEETADLVALFTEYADPQAGSPGDATCVSYALAQASLGEQHLWQDLYLPSRQELSALIGRWYPRLAASNTHDMKWKKFFYKQLCEREEIFVCRSPTCGECSDYPVCFGPE